jgi:hypothetical protein
MRTCATCEWWKSRRPWVLPIDHVHSWRCGREHACYGTSPGCREWTAVRKQPTWWERLKERIWH